MPALAQINGRHDCPTCQAQRNPDPISSSYRDPVVAAARDAAKRASKVRQLVNA